MISSYRALQHVRADHVRRGSSSIMGDGRGGARLLRQVPRSPSRVSLARGPWSAGPEWAGGPWPTSAACVLVLWQVGGRLGNELFPQVDSGEFVLRFRPPPGSNFELTRQMAVKHAWRRSSARRRPGNIDISMGFVGQVAPNYGMNNIVLFMRGPDDGQVRVALRDGQPGSSSKSSASGSARPSPSEVVPWLADPARTGRVDEGAEAHRPGEAGQLRVRARRHRGRP